MSNLFCCSESDKLRKRLDEIKQEERLANASRSVLAKIEQAWAACNDVWASSYDSISYQIVKGAEIQSNLSKDRCYMSHIGKGLPIANLAVRLALAEAIIENPEASEYLARANPYYEKWIGKGTPKPTKYNKDKYEIEEIKEEFPAIEAFERMYEDFKAKGLAEYVEGFRPSEGEKATRTAYQLVEIPPEPEFDDLEQYCNYYEIDLDLAEDAIRRFGRGQ